MFMFVLRLATEVKGLVVHVFELHLPQVGVQLSEHLLFEVGTQPLVVEIKA